MNILILHLACSAEAPHEYGPMVELQKSNGQVYFMDVYEYPNQSGVRPTAEMSFAEATSKCRSHGKRLCTMEEWKLACGANRFTYGPAYEDKKCFTNQPNTQGHTSLMHGRTAQANSGDFPECKSEYGIFDMNGNLEEWVLDDWRGLGGNLAGGAWYTHWQYADCNVRYSREPDYRLDGERPIDSAGVRCCWSDWKLTNEYIQSDAMKFNQSNHSLLPPYDPQNEIEIVDGLWMDRYEYPNVRGSLPRVGVDWFEAAKLCKINGKSLCSVQQWESACTNNTGQGYPYGEKHKNGRCNDEGHQLELLGKNESCSTALGIEDLTGNVWEWTNSDLTVSELQTDPNIPIKEIRGGSYVSDSRKARCTPTVGYPLTSADTRMDTLGFRCCRTTVEETKDIIEQRFEHVCPENMRPHSAGCIDQYEYPNKKDSHPIHSISLHEAAELCLSDGKHLCTEMEWTSVCTQNNNQRWSYGNEYDAKRCHHASQQYGGGSVPSGSFEACKTSDEVFDMTGNLWEWNDSGILRGGNWNFSEGLGQCQSIARPAPHIQNDEIGLRCCATIKEAQALLTTLETHQ